MSEATSNAPAVASAAGKGLNIALWVLQGLLAFAFVGAGSGKLLGRPEMIGLFQVIGIGQWFRYLTGALEITGAILLLVPKTRVLAAGLLASVMLGAIATHLTILHNSPLAPVILLALLGVVLWGRRNEIGRLLGR